MKYYIQIPSKYMLGDWLTAERLGFFDDLEEAKAKALSQPTPARIIGISEIHYQPAQWRKEEV